VYSTIPNPSSGSNPNSLRDAAWWAAWGRATRDAPIWTDGRAVDGLRADLLALAKRCQAAADRLWQANSCEDQLARAQAADDYQDARGEYNAACADVADLQLLLLRHTVEHRREAILGLLLELLASDPDSLQTLARLIREAEKRGA
jgi:hypothetical protein